MDTQAALGFKELFTYVITSMVKALCERPGDSREQQFIQAQATSRMVLAFTPRDTVEAMLAGHCVMLHEMMVESIGETLRAEPGPTRRSTRSAVLSMDRAFGKNLANLLRYQKRESQGTRDAPQTVAAEVPNEPDIADRVRRHREQADREPNAAAPAPVPTPGNATPRSEAATGFHPSRADVAACSANTDAMAALNAGDAARFARALGVKEPCAEYVAVASAQMTEMNKRRAANLDPMATPALAEPQSA
jgi:hypothetical protein